MWLNSGPSTVALCWHGIWVTSSAFVSILIEKREGATDWLASEALKQPPADRPMGIETSPFAGAVEINMMSADLRKLSDPQKELAAPEHIPQESSPESMASHSPRPLPTTGLCSRCQLESSMNRGEK
ncbi:hypothetical protein A4A49_57721, partial [Nicotiana attenuata]